MSLAHHQLFISIGPNPRLVRMCAEEKGLEIPETLVDLRGGENRRDAYLKLNPGGQMPALRLPDGQVIAETLAICEYLEELHPEPALIGSNPAERGETRMWLRRVENLYVRPMIDAYRYGPGLPLFANRMRCLPEAAPDLLLLAHDGEAWLNAQIGKGPYLAGARMTLADVMLFAFVDFAAMRNVMTLDPAHAALQPWFARMAARPSAAATLTV
ncbi:glutathione S-transferase family protein [Pseudooceanicola sp.]|uniref:glutathione S-transferase family protein n=1 Tax=Pseudooceanicola sp. TaxID=1914328 RepID=UPI002637E5AC|nr:glutathione S-transferase family protein [Pseudooceanicola sp.]MDF1854941.1 glutathione S-transferase family protein [Pseudooceanicola sp.]